MQGQDGPEEQLDSLCAAVAADTGLPMGRVRKVLLSARHLQQSGEVHPPPEAVTTPPDPLRYHPLGANGRIHPPIHQPRTGHADDPA